MNTNKLGNIFKGDKVIWMAFFFLCVISIIEVFSASSGLTYKSGSYLAPVFKHMFLLSLGAIAMIFTLNIPCRYFKTPTLILYFGSILGLLWAVIAGEATNNAQRWISFLGIQFQPSEIAKGTIILLTAQILSALQTENGADKRAVKWILGLSAPLILLIFKENFSTAALISLVVFMMFVLGRVPKKLLGYMVACVGGLAVVGFLLIMTIGKVEEQPDNKKLLTEQVEPKKEEKGGIGSYLKRLDTWKSRINKFTSGKDLAPNEVDLDKDAQVAHANIAIASSNIVGRGPGNSVERDFLSQAFSDFIYAIIIEEMGIGGAFFVALLYMVILFRTGTIARRCENNFPAFLAMGYALLLATQAVFNMCVAVGLAPVTGQPLPLVSKGGTSTIINCIFLGVILSVSRSAKVRDESATAPRPVAENDTESN